LAALLNQFFTYTEPDIEALKKRLTNSKERVPDWRAAGGEDPAATRTMRHSRPPSRSSLSLPHRAQSNIRIEAVDEMLVQHLLTERFVPDCLQQPGIRQAQCHRGGSGARHRRSGEQEL